MNQQSQTFGQGNAAGNNINSTGIYQFQQPQPQSQQYQNVALARNLQAQMNFNHNQQLLSQQQMQQMNAQGITHSQVNQLRAMQQQVQANLAPQQQFQASTNVNQQRYQQQNHQRQHQQQSVQHPSNKNHHQQHANNSSDNVVIKELFSQLHSINQKIENITPPDGKKKANMQPYRSGTPTNANNGVPNNVQAFVNTATMGQQPLRRKTSPVPTNTNGSRLSAREILHLHHQALAPLAPKPTKQVHQSYPANGNSVTMTTLRPTQNNSQALPTAARIQQPIPSGSTVPLAVRPATTQHLVATNHTTPQSQITGSQTRNSQDPRMITSIRILTFNMLEIVMPMPPELHAAYMRLHVIERFTMENTMVFKFENRAKQVNETSESTPQASFFLDKLKIARSSLFDNKLSLIGLKCRLCNHRKQYVDGSTSFLDVENPNTLGLFAKVLQSRRTHMIQRCPDCQKVHKEIMSAYVPSKQDIENVTNFCKLWLIVTKACYFNAPRNSLAMTPETPKEKTKVAEILPITEDSIYEDLASAMEMGKAMGDLRLDDLSEAMDRLLSPVMEVLLMSFRLQSNSQTGIELCWKETSSEDPGKLLVWSFDKPFSVDADFCKRIWDFFQEQCKTCYQIPRGLRKLVASSSELPIEELKHVGNSWRDYAFRIIGNQKRIKPKADVKILCPAYIPMPLEYLSPPSSGTFPLKGDFDDNDVVMIGAYRDFIGNRRFRKTVSQFRALYRRLPENKQSFIAEQAIKLIQRRGGSFYSRNGFLAQYEESFQYTQKALQNGFPEMMHPVIPAEAKSVVSDVEFARMIDILPDRKESIKKAEKIMIESLVLSRTAAAASSVDVTGRRAPSRLGQTPPNQSPGATGARNSEAENLPSREGHPIDVSILLWCNGSRSDGRNVATESGKRKKSRDSASYEASKRRKST